MKEDSKNPIYSIPIAVYNFGEGENQPVTSIILEGIGSTIGETREERQIKSNRKFILGTEKVLIISNEAAEKGIQNIINILFSNPLANDKAFAVVFSGNTKEALELNIKGYPSSADYTEGMLESSINYNFFADQYRLIDIFARVEAEGRELVLPYMDVDNDKKELKIIGMAIFDKDKMVRTINVEESKKMNILREDAVRGVITIKDKTGESTDLQAMSNRKIKCKKEKDKYSFTIDLMVKLDIIGNDIYKNLQNDPKEIKALEEDVKEVIEKMCYSFIDKMQEEIKIDCLELGRVAAAKYGRGTGIDWNKIVSEADIKVNVKTRLDRIGRGKY